VSADVVVTADGVVSPGTLAINGTVIESVGTTETRTPDFDVLTPGFVDLQVNGIGGIDVAVANGPDWATLGASLLAQGVTTWCPTLVTAPDADITEACHRVARAMSDGSDKRDDRPFIAGIHLEGPFITVAGAHRVEHIRSIVDGAWVSQLDPAVRIVTLAPELPGALTAITELTENNVLISLGHSACTAEQAHEAAAAGGRLVTHLGNATGPFHQRSPGLLGAALADDRLSVSLIADLEHVHPDLIRLAFSAKSPGRVVLVTDAVATGAGTVGPTVFQPALQPADESGQGRQQGAAARLADGTLAGSALTMERAISNCVIFAGVDLKDAVDAATITPAGLLGLGDRGAIAPEMRADLVGLRWVDANGGRRLRVESVWIAGKIAWTAPRA
jgi:N-acetylglucosamine-6-phosphate deacetylase